jgi:hypothetical protein
MLTAIYNTQHYRVLSTNEIISKLLSATDEIIEVETNKISVFKKLFKGGKKRKRVSAKVIKLKKEIPSELKSFSDSIADAIKQFKAQKV